MTFFVDTTVWSLALRRDSPPEIPQVEALKRALSGTELVVTTGIVVQELLQGLAGAKQKDLIVARFSALAFIHPKKSDYVEAAEISSQCRRSGVQLGTIDALIAQLCIENDLVLLTTDNDFVHASKIIPLKLWQNS